MKKRYFLFLFMLFAAELLAQPPQSEDLEAREMPGEQSATVGNVLFQQQNKYSLPKQGTINERLNDNPLFAANVKNGKLHGSWQSWYQNGMRCDSGKLVRGLPDGVWRYWDDSGQLIAVRTYNADKYHRVRNEMIRYHPKRVSFPLTVLYQKNKQLAIKYLDAAYSFDNAGRTGKDRSLPELVTKNIMPGNIYRPVFDHALHHGLFMNFFPDGTVKDSGYYKNGLKHGVWFHRDKVRELKYKGIYFNGIKVKEWKSYNASGKLQELSFYTSRGILKWRKQFQ
ncbi:MAG: toxin-antitoxin system YwqK family antitoxin [Chitinophagaceae bacterium]